VLYLDCAVVYISRSAVELLDCAFEENRGSTHGMVYVDADTPDVVVRRCAFTRNRAWSGGAIRMYSNIVIEGCDFAENRAYDGDGGALYCHLSSPHVVGCSFRGNSASYNGGAIAGLGANVVVEECLFASNVAEEESGGAFKTSGGSSALAHCVLIGNSSYYGGGVVASQDARVALYGCTFFRNEGTMASGVSATYGSVLSADRSIVAFGLEGPASFCDQTSSVDFACCDIFGNGGGDWVGCLAGMDGANGNFSADPLFCDLEGGDVTLNSASPCAPEHSGGCDLVGALGVACGPTAVEGRSWGGIKALYR
jgi:predicted outer membrane repeat protein